MSLTTRSPMRVVGGNVQSGLPYMAEQATTRGGFVVYSAMSGVNNTTVVYSGGGGRLHDILVISNLNSGQSVLFIDGVPIATSGAPLLGSGQKVIGVIPPVWAIGASGVLIAASQPGAPIYVDRVFHSGLLAAPLASGTPSFSVSYTPECSGFPSVG